MEIAANTVNEIDPADIAEVTYEWKQAGAVDL